MAKVPFYYLSFVGVGVESHLAGPGDENPGARPRLPMAGPGLEERTEPRGTRT